MKPKLKDLEKLDKAVSVIRKFAVAYPNDVVEVKIDNIIPKEKYALPYSKLTIIINGIII